MCNLILTDSAPSRNPTSDLICPRCYAVCSFSSAACCVRCIACAWAVTLTPDQHAELVEALTGISPLPVPAYLQILALQAPAAVATLPA